MKYDIAAALQALKPGAEWVLRGSEWSGLEWLDKSQTAIYVQYCSDRLLVGCAESAKIC